MKVGFIGFGNMAEAIVRGLLSKGEVKKEDIVVSALHEETLARAKEKFGISATLSNQEVVDLADYVFLAIKPQYYQDVIEEIRDTYCEEKVFLSIAPGKTLNWLKEQFQKDVKLVRSMPNTPAAVQEAMTAVCYDECLSDKEQRIVERLFQSIGKVESVKEEWMDAVVGISGSSPAYIFILIEAMADSGVKAGLSRDLAYRFASQAVLGSAKMVLETGVHPAELKDMVCSPAGTTIEAVIKLEEKGFRSAVMESIAVCIEKSKKM